MGKPILYGIHLSPPVRGVLLVCKAIGVEIEFREVNLLAGEHKKPEFLKINPQHTVPVLDDNGFILSDSHAIATYLIGKYAKDDSLYPKDLCKRALVDQRLHFDSGVLFVRLRAIFERILFFDEGVIPELKMKALNQAYEFMEKFLENDSYLVGNSITVADLSCISTISSTQGVLPSDAGKFPKLAAWIKRMEQLPYYEETNGKGAKAVIALVSNKIAELNKK